MTVVAPLVGAWIEIQHPRSRFIPVDVAPLVGAWIEIREIKQERVHYPVAPLVGAWIEITGYVRRMCRKASLPSWERGLKFGYCIICVLDDHSRSPRGSVD